MRWNRERERDSKRHLSFSYARLGDVNRKLDRRFIRPLYAILDEEKWKNNMFPRRAAGREEGMLSEIYQPPKATKKRCQQNLAIILRAI